MRLSREKKVKKELYLKKVRGHAGNAAFKIVFINDSAEKHVL